MDERVYHASCLPCPGKRLVATSQPSWRISRPSLTYSWRPRIESCNTDAGVHLEYPNHVVPGHQLQFA